MIGYTFPRKPTPGGPLRTKWGDSVSRSVRQIAPIQVPGMLISRGVYGTRYMPEETYHARTINLGTLRPFDVRWFSYGENDDGSSKGGQWQIYLPLGCLTVMQGGEIYSYIPTNDTARDENGERISDWYKIDEPDDDTYANVTEEEDRVVTCYAVYLNMKPWPRVHVSADPTDFDPVQWKVAVGEMRIANYEDENRKERYGSRITLETQIAKTWDISSPFSIRYDIAEGSFKDKGAEPSVMLVNQTRFIGRLQETIADDMDISSWEDVWIKILHNGEKFEMSVDHNLEGDDAKSDDDKTVYKIYDINERVVKLDLRSSVPVMDFYTSPATATADRSGITETA